MSKKKSLKETFAKEDELRMKIVEELEWARRHGVETEDLVKTVAKVHPALEPFVRLVGAKARNVSDYENNPEAIRRLILRNEALEAELNRLVGELGEIETRVAAEYERFEAELKEHLLDEDEADSWDEE